MRWRILRLLLLPAFCRTVRSRQKMNGGIELAGNSVGINILLHRELAIDGDNEL
jgi:hypothetical protein